MSAPLPNNPGRILLIKPSAIGDVVHALPVLNLMRKRWPTAHIAWLVTSTCAGLVEGHPQLNETLIFDRNKLSRAWQNTGAATDLVRFSRLLKEKQFELVVDLQGLFRSAWMARQTKAPYRVGFANAREFAPWFYTHKVPITTMEQHAVERYMKVADFLGCGDGPVEFQFAVDDDDRSAVSKMVRDESRYAVILPGSNWLTKRWPIEQFATLVTPLQERFGLRTIIAGGPGDTELAARIPGALDLCGKTTLRHLVALLERATVVIANDSGPTHIAAALNRPLVAIYGPTNPVRTGPFDRIQTVLNLDLPCRPCYSRHCSHLSCLRWLSAEAVLKQVGDQIQSASAVAG